MLGLHGAGVEADSEQVRSSFDAAPDLQCWLVSPTGMTPWSGDDWRKFSAFSFKFGLADFSTDHWGFADAEAAIAAVPEWIESVAWQGPAVDITQWLVAGHSNGGTYLKKTI